MYSVFFAEFSVTAQAVKVCRSPDPMTCEEALKLQCCSGKIFF